MDESEFQHPANTPDDVAQLLQRHNITLATRSQATMEEILTFVAHVHAKDASKSEALVRHLASIQTFQESDLTATWDFIQDLLSRMDAEDETLLTHKPPGGSTT